MTAFTTLCSSNREGSLTAPVHNDRYWGLVVSRCGRVHVTLFIHNLSCLAPTLGRQDNLKTILRRQPETPRTTPTKMMVRSNNNGTVCCLFHIGSPLPIQLVTSEVCRITMGIYASLSLSFSKDSHQQDFDATYDLLSYALRVPPNSYLNMYMVSLYQALSAYVLAS